MDVVVAMRLVEGLDVAYSMELVEHVQLAFVEHASVVEYVANPVVAKLRKKKFKCISIKTENVN